MQYIDFYHRVEHLGKVASLRKNWSSTKRKSWVRKHRKLLLQGQVDEVVCAVQAICRCRNSKEIRTQRSYFVKSISRMAYYQIRALQHAQRKHCRVASV